MLKVETHRGTEVRTWSCTRRLSPRAVAAYEAAVVADAHSAVMVGLRYRLAQLYMADADFPAAVRQYDAVLELAQTQNTLGEANYLAGYAELLAGNPDEGYARYLETVQAHPQAYESYLALVDLIDAGYEVDEFQRGLVDFYAKAYDPAVMVCPGRVHPMHRPAKRPCVP